MTKSTAKKKKKWGRYVILAFAILVGYHILTGPSGVLSLFQLRKSNADFRKGTDSLRVRKQELEMEKIRLVTDTAYIEKVARKELGMAKPNEKVFRYVAPREERNQAVPGNDRK